MKKIINRIKYNFYYAYYSIQNYISKQILKMYEYEQFNREAYTWKIYEDVMRDFSVDGLRFLQKTKYFFLSLINRIDIHASIKEWNEYRLKQGEAETEGEFLERKRKDVLSKFNEMSFFEKVGMYYYDDGILAYFDRISDYIQNQIDLVYRHKINIEASSFHEANSRYWNFYDSEARSNMGFFEKAYYFFLSLINSMDIKILSSLVDEIYGKSKVVHEYKSLEDIQKEALKLFEKMSFLDKVSKYLTSFLSEEMVDICLDHGVDNNFTADQVKHLAHFIDIDFSKLLKARNPRVKKITYYHLANLNILLELQKNSEKELFLDPELDFYFDPMALIKLMTLVDLSNFGSILSKFDLLSETEQNQKNILAWLNNSISSDRDYSEILAGSTDKLQSNIDFLDSLNEVLSNDEENASPQESQIKKIILLAIEHLTQQIQSPELQSSAQASISIGSGQGPRLVSFSRTGSGDDLPSASNSSRM